MNPASTYVIELTPRGRGAVAVVLVSGPDAVPTVERCFARPGGRPLVQSPIGAILVGRWGGEGGEELVVCRRAAAQVEVHCHGGVAAVEAVMERLEREGCRRAAWPEWLQSVEPDPLRAAARIALADATTARTSAILLDQYHGALGAAIQSTAMAIASGDWQRAAEQLDAALAFGEQGQHLTKPWRVVLAGPPNVGKSSLINRLAGFQRSIVSQQPGTTRDVVTLSTAIDGWPVEIADTAGLRVAGDELEAAGAERAGAAIAQADLILAVRDATDVPARIGRDEAATGTSGRQPRRHLYVWNKIDLLPPERKPFKAPAGIATSTVTGEGIAALVAAIGHALVPAAPPVEAAVPFRPGHVAALEAARAAVARREAIAANVALQSLLAGEIE